MKGSLTAQFAFPTRFKAKEADLKDVLATLYMQSAFFRASKPSPIYDASCFEG